jgi:hypothetical protein
MPYSQFTTLKKAKDQFELQTIEGVRFLPAIDPISPSPRLMSQLEDIPWAIAVGSEKARSEAIIYPVLQEVRRVLELKVSLFSGEDFSVNESQGLSGVCDFLISRSSEMVSIEAPAVVIVEAKRADLKLGLGQCAAEMVAAQAFNQINHQPVATIYGCVTSGTQWRFLQLQGKTLTIDLTDYPLPPVEQILGFLVWMASSPD